MGTEAVAEYRRTRSETSPTSALTSERWRLGAGVEVALAAVVVLADLAIPTFLILALMTLSLLIRHAGLATVGFHRASHPWILAGKMLTFAAGWSLVSIGLLKPIVNHVTGTTQDMSQFTGLEGNLTLLLAWVGLSWTVAALGEELAFRGFVQTRMTELVGATGARLVVAVVMTSILMGLLHTEYGFVGVAASAVDSVVYSVLRYRYQTLWASVLAHGFVDTIGFVTFFLIGPIYGLW